MALQNMYIGENIFYYKKSVGEIPTPKILLSYFVYIVYVF